MEEQRQYDVLADAQTTLEGAQLSERPVLLQPFVIHDLMGVVSGEHDRRVTEGIYEPLYDGGPDIAHELVEKVARALPATKDGYEVAVPLNDPQIKFIRELLEEESQRQQADTYKKDERESDLISFDNAVDDSLLGVREEDNFYDGALELTDKGREMVAKLLKEREKLPRKMNVRSGSSTYLQWSLASYLDEEQMMRPKYSPEFDENYEVGRKTLTAFGKGRTFDKDDKGNPRLTEVVLTKQQIDFLKKNLTTLTAGTEEYQAKAIRELVEGVDRSFDSAPIAIPSKGMLRKFFNKFTGQK